MKALKTVDSKQVNVAMETLTFFLIFVQHSCFTLACHECVFIHIFEYEQVVITVIPQISKELLPFF